MPTYRATIEKLDTLSGYRWRNVYLLLTSSATDAQATAVAFATWESNVSYDTVEFVSASVVNVADKNDRKGGSFGGTLMGALSRTGLGGPLPLYVTVLVTFTDNVGRPEKKFLRVGAQRDNLNNGFWDPTWLADLNTNYSENVLGELTFVGPHGERPTSVSTSNIPTDRQQGWHRRHRPGFRRGWVPA